MPPVLRVGEDARDAATPAPGKPLEEAKNKKKIMPHIIYRVVHI